MHHQFHCKVKQVFPYLMATSVRNRNHTIIPLFFARNALVVSKTKELYDRCQHEPVWESKEGVLTVYIQATFLHFLRFQSAEMTKTELFVETVPQLIVRTTYLVERFVAQGLVTAVTAAGWIERLAVPFSFFFPPLQVVLSTFKKQEYYFAVYRLGQNFETQAREEDRSGNHGQRIMPSLSLPYKGFCVLAHMLTMGKLVRAHAITFERCSYQEIFRVVRVILLP